MKRCSMCGEIYDERVDFCFDDGTPLEAIAEEKVAAAAAPDAGVDLSGLDAPDPENISGLDAPDPMGVDWSSEPESRSDEEEPAQPAETPEAAVPFAATIPESPTPETAVHTVETEVSGGAGQLPAGFSEPPSQFEAGESQAEDEFWDGNDDDLDFPDSFGTGEGTFGQEYTDPTIPLPSRPGGGGAKKAVAGVMLAVVALLAFALSRGGGADEEAAETVAATEVQRPIREIETPPTAPVNEPEVETEQEAPAEEMEETPEEVPELVEEPQPEVEEVQEVVDPEPEPTSRPREVAVSRPVAPVQPAVEEMVEAVDQNAASEVDPWATAQPEVATSRVRVFSKPSGASLYVDGRAYGSTPAELDLDQGQHSIRVEKEGYFAESRSVSISGATHLERFEMRPESQRVTVNCYGPDSSKVYLDGKVICAIPGSGTVTTGEHTFRVVTPDRFYRKVLNVQRKSDGSPTPLRFTE